MIKLLTRKTQLASAALITGILFSSSNDAMANSTDLVTTTTQLGNQAEKLPQLINGVFFIAGAGLVGLGLFGVKKHVDSNGQEKLPPALAKAGVGGALMALPVFADNAINTVLGSNSTTAGVTSFTGANTRIF